MTITSCVLPLDTRLCDFIMCSLIVGRQKGKDTRWCNLAAIGTIRATSTRCWGWLGTQKQKRNMWSIARVTATAGCGSDQQRCSWRLWSLMVTLIRGLSSLLSPNTHCCPHIIILRPCVSERPQRAKRRGGTDRTSCGPFTLAMCLGERKSPSSVSDLRESSTRVAPLRDARTKLADFFSILLSQPSPLRKGGSLPDSLPLSIHDIPDEGVLDEKASSCRSNSHTLIRIEIAARSGLFQHPFPLSSIDRLSCEPRRGFHKLLPSQLP